MRQNNIKQCLGIVLILICAVSIMPAFAEMNIHTEVVDYKDEDIAPEGYLAYENSGRTRR